MNIYLLINIKKYIAKSRAIISVDAIVENSLKA